MLLVQSSFPYRSSLSRDLRCHGFRFAPKFIKNRQTKLDPNPLVDIGSTLLVKSQFSDPLFAPKVGLKIVLQLSSGALGANLIIASATFVRLSDPLRCFDTSPLNIYGLLRFLSHNALR